MSGGDCWVGNNPKISAAGISDTDDEALTYLEAITAGEISRPRLKSYLRNSQRMVTWFEENTSALFAPLVKYTEDYPEQPGGKSDGRSMESRPFDGSALGTELIALRRPHPQVSDPGKVRHHGRSGPYDARRRLADKAVDALAGLPLLPAHRAA
jgi:3-oxosteroid 1-dehydrogenase